MSVLTQLLELGTLHHLCETPALRAELRGKLTPQPGVKELQGNLTVAEGESVIFEEAEVHVVGDLVLEDQARMYVAGDLRVDGNILAASWDYSLLFAGGRIEASNLVSNGELVALGGLKLRGVAWTFENSYSTYADTLSAKVVVRDERYELVEDTRSGEFLENRQPDFAARLEVLIRQELSSDDQGFSPRAFVKRLAPGETILREG